MKGNPLNEFVDALLEEKWFYFMLGILAGYFLNNLS